MKKPTQSEINERNRAIETLHEWLEPGDTVYTVLRHVSRSGMMRHISLFIHYDNGVKDITYFAARAMDDKMADNGGIKISGCGMDMGFELVYRLGYTLWPNGTSRTTGGYALHHQWL